MNYQLPGRQNWLIFSSFFVCDAGSCLKRTKTLPRRSWDAPRTLQDAPGRLLDSIWGVTWGLLGPSWAPRRPQDATNACPRAAQNTPQDALGSQNRTDIQNRSKMNSRTPRNRAPNLVGKLQDRAKTLFENFENPAQTLLENFRNRAPNPPKSNPNGAVNF